ncbi:MAG: glycosyltransferase family 39 protein, partial [Candidatus Auribacterota bacterium]|nr:glycosyltransferase family 39 protein [Candidatus Auribacterota bacterium]
MKNTQIKILPGKFFISLLILIIVGSVTFYPILENGFTNWDDPAQLLENPLVRELSARNLSEIFTAPVVSEYHPLVTAIFSLEYHLFGPNPFPYHLHSLILHLINGWLVFFIFYRLSDKLSVALAGSLLFLVNPLQVQSVAWISARKDLIFTCFYLSSFLSYSSFLSNKKKIFYFLALIFFICALLSKALAVTLPVILLLWIYSEKKRIISREFKLILPFIFLAAAAGWFALRMQVVREAGSAAHLDFSLENVILLFENLYFYLIHLLFPFNLSPIYIFPKSINFWDPLFWSSLLIIFSLSIGLWLNRKNKHLIRGVVFFFITLFPVLRFIPFAGVEVAAHRFVYLSCVGIFYIGGWIFYWLTWRGAERIWRDGIIILWTAIIISMSILSAQRCL